MGKFYISEKQAAEILSKSIGQSITSDDMVECANLGVVPAYIKFKPVDKKLYPGKAFHLVHEKVVSEVEPGCLTTFEGCEEDFWKVVPFPLLPGGVVNTNAGFTYSVFVASSDANLEAVSEQHCVRVYAPQEVRQAVKNVRRYMSGLGFQPIGHGCGETWEIDRDHDHDQRTDWIISPFSNALDAINLTKRKRRTSDDVPVDGELPSRLLIIAGMLEMIKGLGPKGYYTQEKIIERLQQLLPKEVYRGMGEDSIKKAFAAANEARRNSAPASGKAAEGLPSQ